MDLTRWDLLIFKASDREVSLSMMLVEMIHSMLYVVSSSQCPTANDNPPLSWQEWLG